MGYGGASNVEHARDGRIAKLFEEQGQHFLFECFIEASGMATQVLHELRFQEWGRLAMRCRASEFEEPAGCATFLAFSLRSGFQPEALRDTADVKPRDHGSPKRRR